MFTSVNFQMGAWYGLAAKALALTPRGLPAWGPRVKAVIALAARTQVDPHPTQTLADAAKGTPVSLGFVAGLLTKERLKGTAVSGCLLLLLLRQPSQVS